LSHPEFQISKHCQDNAFNKKFLGLHDKHNSFPEPSPTLMSERMPTFFSYESEIESGIQFRFVKFLYSFLKPLNQILKSYFEIFQTLSSNLLDLNPWPKSRFLSSEEIEKHAFKFPFWSTHFSCKNLKKPISYPFLQFSPSGCSPSPSPLLCKPSKVSAHWPNRVPRGLLLPPTQAAAPPPPHKRAAATSNEDPARCLLSRNQRFESQEEDLNRRQLFWKLNIEGHDEAP
jgi:hypothetical protein